MLAWEYLLQTPPSHTTFHSEPFVGLALQMLDRCKESIWDPSLLDGATNTRGRALPSQLLPHMITVIGNAPTDTQQRALLKSWASIPQSSQADNMDEPS